MDREFRTDVCHFLTFEIPMVITRANSVPLRNSVFCQTMDLYVSYYAENKSQLFAYSVYSVKYSV